MCPARPQPLQGLAYECSLLYYGTPSPRRKIDSPLFAVYCWSQRTAKRTKKIMIFRTGRCTFRSTRVSSKVERVPRGTFQIPQSWLGLINSWKPDAKSSYIYRVQSSVWHLPNYWSPTLSPPSECVLPPHQRRVEGVHTRRAVRGCGVNISKDARHWMASYCIIPLQPDVSVW
jgi:hypothetical protein